MEYLMLILYVHDTHNEEDYHQKILLFYAFIYSLDAIEA